MFLISESQCTAHHHGICHVPMFPDTCLLSSSPLVINHYNTSSWLDHLHRFSKHSDYKLNLIFINSITDTDYCSDMSENSLYIFKSYKKKDLDATGLASNLHTEHN